MDTDKWYKVLVKGRSCNGGTLQWDLPKDGKPGKWHGVEGELSRCEHGIHLTHKPYAWYKWGCTCYEAEPDLSLPMIPDDGTKAVFTRARLSREVPHPDWWVDVVRFAEETIPAIPWFQRVADPLPEWRLFEADTIAAALDAARDAAWDAAWDFALHARMIVCRGLPVEERHRRHAAARMEVWRRGYGLLCHKDGVFHVYAPTKRGY